MAGVFAVFALHASRVLEKVATQRTAHDVIELLYNKFVTIQFVDLFFTLSHGTFAIQSDIEWSSIPVLFRCSTLAGRK